jgi:hypothetical protein
MSFWLRERAAAWRWGRGRRVTIDTFFALHGDHWKSHTAVIFKWGKSALVTFLWPRNRNSHKGQLIAVRVVAISDMIRGDVEKNDKVQS